MYTRNNVLKLALLRVMNIWFNNSCERKRMRWLLWLWRWCHLWWRRLWHGNGVQMILKLMLQYHHFSKKKSSLGMTRSTNRMVCKRAGTVALNSETPKTNVWTWKKSSQRGIYSADFLYREIRLFILFQFVKIMHLNFK